MKSFTWNKSFVTGFDSVDNQHQELVTLINGLGDLLTENRFDEVRAQELIQKLADYAQYHFQEEEALMVARDIDGRHLKHHIDDHRHFLQEVALLQQSINTETSASYMLEFLIHWLAYHILGQDQNMARQLEQIEAGIPAADAFDEQQHSQDPATGTLLDAISRLFKQVSARNQELQELNLTLEEKVAKRTQELSEANRHLEMLSLTDTLTQLPNRRHAMQTLEALWKEGKEKTLPVTAMLVDADYFKQVNDTYGHDAGDQVLIDLARTLKGAVRTDDLVCRLGGDEFLVLCPNTDLTGGQILAEQLVNKVAALRVATGGAPWQGSISLGFASQVPETGDFEALIKAADQGVYAAKEAGRGCARQAVNP